jgi:Uma2 family endonuclease
MDVLVLDSNEQDALLRRREASDADRFDEVWDGVYIVSPNPNIEHQGLGSTLCTILTIAVQWANLGQLFQGVNVSDRSDNWKQNYRVPDLAVFLNSNRALDRGTHWLGGPDFVVEIISAGDRSRQKLAFYASLGVREVLLIDRDPWHLELYRLEETGLNLAGQNVVDDPSHLVSQVLPLSFRLAAGADRPHVEVIHADGIQRWLA